jgi:hypothetical protein
MVRQGLLHSAVRDAILKALGTPGANIESRGIRKLVQALRYCRPLSSGPNAWPCWI